MKSKRLEKCAEARLARKEHFRRAHDAAALPRVGRRPFLRRARARLDLDEGEHRAAPGDDVDLAERAAPVAGDDAPSAQAQTPAAQAFGMAAETLRAAPRFNPASAHRRRRRPAARATGARIHRPPRRAGSFRDMAGGVARGHGAERRREAVIEPPPSPAARRALRRPDHENDLAPGRRFVGEFRRQRAQAPAADLFVTLGQFPGDGDPAVVELRRERSASVAARRRGDSNSTVVMSRAARVSSAARRAPPRGGRKPRKAKRSVGRPTPTAPPLRSTAPARRRLRRRRPAPRRPVGSRGPRSAACRASLVSATAPPRSRTGTMRGKTRAALWS